MQKFSLDDFFCILDQPELLHFRPSDYNPFLTIPNYYILDYILP